MMFMFNISLKQEKIQLIYGQGLCIESCFYFFENMVHGILN